MLFGTVERSGQPIPDPRRTGVVLPALHMTDLNAAQRMAMFVDRSLRNLFLRELERFAKHAQP